ncbi:TonB-dependent receptor [Flaviaesturariibacter amylovorans]|uniref:TonB-dependent siderophore receptor n=1 Tax=Flaviaesturariibacter amylovorans TaxID=1084520 RepID=A0ABP8HP68_9BACT
MGTTARRFLFFLSSCLVLLTAAASEAPGKISGTVRSAEGLPAAFVTVQVKETKQSTATNEDGVFHLFQVAPGNYTLQLTAIGFEPLEQIVTVAADNTLQLELRLAQSARQLAQVVVTGQKRRTSTVTKTNIPLLDLPMSIQVIDQQIIRQQAAFDLKDIVRNVSGVNQTGSYNGGYQFFNSRGFDMNNWTNFRRNGTLLWNMGNHYADFYESVEFLKGPSAILYGDVAPGGVINFVTKKPLPYNYGRIDLRVGEYGLVRPAVDLAGPLDAKGKVLYRLNTSYERSKSFRDVVENETVMMAPALTWNISPKASWNVELNYKNDERVGDPGLVSPDGTFEGLRRISEKTFLGEREATYGYKNTSLISTFKVYLGKQWYLQQTSSVMQTLRTPLNVYVNNDADAAGNVTRYQYFFRQKFNTRTAMLDAVGEVATGPIRHKLLVGADFMDDGIRMGGFLQDDIAGTINLYRPEQGKASLKALPLVWDNNAGFTRRIGLYAQDQLSFLNDKLQVLLGVRYNRYVSGTRYDNKADKPADYTEVVEKPLVPRLGVVYKPLPYLSVYTSYAESYEVNGFDWIDARKQVPPTFGTQYEAGIKADLLQKRLGVTLSVFNIEKENVYSWAESATAPSIDYVSWSAQEGYYTYLAKRHRSRGIELDINGRVNDNLNILATGSYIRAEIVDDIVYQKGNRLANQPREMFSLWANYTFSRALKGLSLGYGAFYKGAFFADASNAAGGKVPANYTMDASVGYSWKQWSAQVNVSNLTDRVSYLGAFGSWEPQWTRRTVLTLSYKL